MICIKNGTLHTAVSKETFIADILIDGGKIVKIGKGLSADGAEVIDATGLQVYPGFVEAHCHIGLDGYGIGYEGHDYNELNDPVTPQVQAIDGINPFDPCMKMAAKAGVPASQPVQAAPTPLAEPSLLSNRLEPVLTI